MTTQRRNRILVTACGSLLFVAAWMIGLNYATKPVEAPEMIELQTLVAHRMPDDFRAAVEADKEHAKLDSERSPGWGRFSDHCIDLHPFCTACGLSREDGKKSGNMLASHHKFPFHRMSAAQRGSAIAGGEFDPNNIIVLCFRHHLSIGHLGNWKHDNPNVDDDAKKFAKALKARGAWP